MSMGKKVKEVPGVVQGIVRDDFEKNGYKVSDPPLSPNPILRKGMRLLVGAREFALQNRNTGGGYTFTAPPGNYTVEASCPGFVTQAKPVTITSGGTTIKNFGLQRP